MDVPVKEWTKNDWNTPPEVVEPMQELFRGPPLLDPFDNITSITGAYVRFTSEGFDVWHEQQAMQDRVGRGARSLTAYVNPPFNRTGEAVYHCVKMWMLGWEIVGLFPVSSNSRYHAECIDEAPAVCYPRKRIRFWKDGGPADSPRNDCLLVYWGTDPWRFRQAFRELGRCRFG